jgi:hypothetical protein
MSLYHCTHCNSEVGDIEYCSECNENLCIDCYNEEGHYNHNDGGIYCGIYDDEE